MKRRLRKKRARVLSPALDSGIATGTSDDKPESSDSDAECITRAEDLTKRKIPPRKKIKQEYTHHYYEYNPIYKGFYEKTNTNQNTRKQKESPRSASKEKLLWKQSVPIKISDNIDELTKQMINDAIESVELQTCLHFPERTDEEDYVQFDKENGCWSYVGRMGGPQTISIGSGCEEIGTILHEIMHAIGIHHEHSRPDRDDYVKIIWSEIPKEMKTNFAKEARAELDEPYDYESLMHYSEDHFSKSGKPTIRTLDPQYQDVIGQRYALSKGDRRKINRMYKCDETVLKSATVDFESGDFGGFTQTSHGKQPQWRLQKNGDRLKDPDVLLPSADSTFEKEGQGSYVYMKNEGEPGLIGKLHSIQYISKATKQCLVFSMKRTGNAALHIHFVGVDPATDDTIEFGSPVHKFTIGCDDTWCVHRKTIHAPSNYRIVFRGRFEDDSAGIIAIDDVSTIDRKCEDFYFTVKNYGEKMESYKTDEYVESGTIYTAEPGYAYKLRVFPNGTQAGIDNKYFSYTEIQIAIVGGKYDNQLTWPMPRHTVKLCVNDQTVNPLTGMDHCEYFYIGGDSLSTTPAYQKPRTIGEPNKPITFFGFMKNSKFTTKRFLKQGSAVFSTTIASASRSQVYNPTSITQKYKSGASDEHTKSRSIQDDRRLPSDNKDFAKSDRKNDYESSSNETNVEYYGKVKWRHRFGDFAGDYEDEEYPTEKAWEWATREDYDTKFYDSQYRPSKTTSTAETKYRNKLSAKTCAWKDMRFTEPTKMNTGSNFSEFGQKDNNAMGEITHPNKESMDDATNSRGMDENNSYDSVREYCSSIFHGFLSWVRDICSFIYHNSPDITGVFHAVDGTYAEAPRAYDTSNPPQTASNPSSNSTTTCDNTKSSQKTSRLASHKSTKSLKSNRRRSKMSSSSSNQSYRPFHPPPALNYRSSSSPRASWWTSNAINMSGSFYTSAALSRSPSNATMASGLLR